MVYGELGRYPLHIHINVRMIGFWLKLKSSDKLSRNVYQLLYILKESKDFRFKRLDHIFKICNPTGMNYYVSNCNLNVFYKTNLYSHGSLIWIKVQEDNNEFLLKLPYLLKLSQVKFTRLCKLRTCNMKIPIETGRSVNISQEKKTL
jgi:hypothetical protein